MGSSDQLFKRGGEEVHRILGGGFGKSCNVD